MYILCKYITISTQNRGETEQIVTKKINLKFKKIKGDSYYHKIDYRGAL